VKVFKELQMAQDFDWNDDEAVVVPSQDALAVYLNPRADVVVRRQRAWDEDEDVFVAIPRAHAKRIANLIIQLAEAGLGEEV
jgi:hypothetical protein